MEISVAPGRYVVAVSGGVDSVVLLDLLRQVPEVVLVVAHFDHGIRPDSGEDRLLVATLSQKHSLPFEYREGKLGPKVSEAEARQARYDFLQQIRNKHNAQGVITAHHQDDALETLSFNVLRGTKRKGMSSLQSTDGIIRPLMNYGKAEILDYARQQGLVWREDSTNQDEKYSRNWIRRRLLPKLSRQQKQELADSYNASKIRNQELDRAVQAQLEKLSSGGGLARKDFIALPYSVACEVMAAWLRQHKTMDFDRRLVDQLVVSAKTLPPGKKISLGHKHFLVVGPDLLQLD